MGEDYRKVIKPGGGDHWGPSWKLTTTFIVLHYDYSCLYHNSQGRNSIWRLYFSSFCLLHNWCHQIHNTCFMREHINRKQMVGNPSGHCRNHQYSHLMVSSRHILFILLGTGAEVPVGNYCNYWNKATYLWY